MADTTKARDREADRARYPDKDFNDWLDCGISDCGHTVYDTINDVNDAWQGWHAHAVSMMLEEPVFDIPVAGKNLERAIDLAEDHCGMPFDEARDELKASRLKCRDFDLLWERAHTVIAVFEALGKTRSVPEQMTLLRRCEAAMVALKETLNP